MSTGEQFADRAIELLNGEIIYYNAEAMRKAKDSGKTCADCQAFMELIAKKCGASMTYTGSNDMFRHACTWVGTIADARKQGKLQRGCALFILEHDGNEPAQYRADGIGNASHVGMYIGEKAFYDDEKKRWCNVAHSSSSRGKVCGSTLQNAWTHVGLWKCADFSIQNNGGDTMGSTNTGTAIVQASSGDSVNFRQGASKTTKLCSRNPKIMVGDSVDVLSSQGEWSQVTYNGETGYVMTQFLKVGDGVLSDMEQSDGAASNSSAVEVLAQIEALVAKLKTMM